MRKASHCCHTHTNHGHPSIRNTRKRPTKPTVRSKCLKMSKNGRYCRYRYYGSLHCTVDHYHMSMMTWSMVLSCCHQRYMPTRIHNTFLDISHHQKNESRDSNYVVRYVNFGYSHPLDHWSGRQLNDSDWQPKTRERQKDRKI